jgi:hypothetical protein
VYEGDVIQTDELGWVGFVKFGAGGFYLEDMEHGFSGANYLNWKACRIIGNLCESPELAERL